MQRIVTVVVVTGLILVGVAMAWAGDGSEVSGGAGRQELRAERAFERALDGVVPRIVSWDGPCNTLKCINVRLNKLRVAVNNAQSDVDALNACIDFQGMSRSGDPGGAFGYVWRNEALEESLRTAIDFAPADGADVLAVVWNC